MIRFDAAQRRALLAQRHLLGAGAGAAGATTAEEVADRLVALHSTDPASVYLSCLARMPEAGGGGVADVDRALYQDRSLVRMLGMRRTVFVVPAHMEAVVHVACTQDIAAVERRKLERLVETAGIAPTGGGAAWLGAVEADVLAALADRGEAMGQELGEAVPALRTTYSVGDQTKKWGGPVAIGTRVLFLLAADGQIVRGRPRGTWASSQYRWLPRASWTDRAQSAITRPGARQTLARRWLASYGPATVKDLAWWSGWTLGDTRKVLAQIPVVEVELDGQPGIALDDAAGQPRPAESRAILLPALDPTVMGWADRSWFLPEGILRDQLFDRSGNAGPTLWWDNQVVGGWAQRRDGEVVWRVLVEGGPATGAEAQAAITAVAERTAAAIGTVRVTPRFRTPLERALSE